MGLFDYIHIQYPLPDKQYQDCEFQTKSLYCSFDGYTITKDGRLVWNKHKMIMLPESAWKTDALGVVQDWDWVPDRDIDMEFHGYVFVAGLATPEYRIKFTNGWVVSIDKVAEAPIVKCKDDGSFIVTRRD